MWYGQESKAGGSLKYAGIKYINIQNSPDFTFFVREMSKTQTKGNKAKREGQTIHALQQKLHQEKMKNRVKQATSNYKEVPHRECAEKLKDLVMGVVNPEGSGGLRWPDIYSEGTSTIRQLMNLIFRLNPLKRILS